MRVEGGRIPRLTPDCPGPDASGLAEVRAVSYLMGRGLGSLIYNERRSLKWVRGRDDPICGGDEWTPAMSRAPTGANRQWRGALVCGYCKGWGCLVSFSFNTRLGQCHSRTLTHNITVSFSVMRSLRTNRHHYDIGIYRTLLCTTSSQYSPCNKGDY